MFARIRSWNRWKKAGFACGGCTILLLTLFLWFFAVDIYLASLSRNDAKRIPYVVTQLKSSNYQRRATAAQALGNIGPAATMAIPDLLRALGDESPHVASEAACALGLIDGFPSNRPWSPLIAPSKPNQDVIAALMKQLSHRDGEARRYAAYALSFYGPQARSAVPVLTAKLSDEHMACMAVRALGEMGPTARDSIPQIATLLASSKPEERAEAAVALSKLLPLSTEVVSAIARLTADDQDMVKNTAQRAMETIRSSQTPPAKQASSGGK